MNLLWELDLKECEILLKLIMETKNKHSVYVAFLSALQSKQDFTFFKVKLSKKDLKT